MENKLRKKLIILVAVSVMIVFVITSFCVYYFSKSSINSDSDIMTKFISENGGSLPEFDDIYNKESIIDSNGLNFSINADTPFGVRFFVVNFDVFGNLINTNTDKIASINNNEAYEMAKHVLNQWKEVGDYHKYRYRIVWRTDGISIIFLDCRKDIDRLNYYTIVFVIVEICIFLLINIIFGILSKKIIKPFVRNHQLQKQFITDAGHELKTPLAIISVNADVLEYKTQGNSKWIKAIKDQVTNMSNLISELINLSKLEEMKLDINLESFNVSELVKSLLNNCKEIFIEKNVTTDINISEDIIIKNDKANIEKIFSILLDNASKHVPKKGILKIELTNYLKGAKFVISNTDENKEKIDCEKLFERFYRTDKSRNSKSGGHGIGLSIAKRLCDQTSCSINAKQKNQMMIFTVLLSNNNKLIDFKKIRNK